MLWTLLFERLILQLFLLLQLLLWYQLYPKLRQRCIIHYIDRRECCALGYIYGLLYQAKTSNQGSAPVYQDAAVTIIASHTLYFVYYFVNLLSIVINTNHNQRPGRHPTSMHGFPNSDLIMKLRLVIHWSLAWIVVLLHWHRSKLHQYPNFLYNLFGFLFWLSKTEKQKKIIKKLGRAVMLSLMRTHTWPCSSLAHPIPKIRNTCSALQW